MTLQTDRPGAAPVKRRWRRVDGVLLLDKAGGASSNGVLQQVRRLYGAAKAGHGGTLDPMATGLLVVCFGEATKFLSWMLESEKRYTGELLLGVRTDTGDAEGNVIEHGPVSPDAPDCRALAAAFTGVIRQRPPVYSALKVNGRPLYEYARAGVAIEAKERDVTIHELGLTFLPPDRLRFDVRCSSGTYIRSLAEDLALRLGTVGHLTSLRRRASGPFDLSMACGAEALADRSEAERESCLLPPDVLPYRLGRVRLDAATTAALRHGRVVGGVGPDGPGPYRLYTPEGGFLGVGELGQDGCWRAVRLMATGETATPPKTAS